MRRIERGFAASACAAVVALAAPAWAADPASAVRSATPSKGADARLTVTERTFLQQAAAGGLFEVESGRLAAEKGSDPAVRSLGSMLVDDHSAANDELKRLASQYGVTLPDAPSAAQRTTLQGLRKASGSDFDRQFLKDVGLRAHQQDIRLFESASRYARAADVKAFAEKTLPVLHRHFEQAEKVAPARKP